MSVPKVFKFMNDPSRFKKEIKWSDYTVGGRKNALIYYLYKSDNSGDASAFISLLPGASADLYRHLWGMSHF